MYTILTQENLEELDQSLHYLHVPELREVCERLHLPASGKKAAIIASIVHFIKTGKIKKGVEIPAASRAEKGKNYPLHPKTRMVLGNFKNDLKTRIFFKSLIGPHFHYTAYGLDWLKSRWYAGDPPTYQEFAEFWQEEHFRRQNKQNPLKQEWAYLSFLRRFAEKNPSASKNQTIMAWEKARQEHVEKAQKLLETFYR